MLVVLVCSLGVQLAKGYTQLRASAHYLFDLFVVQLPGFMLIAVLALTVHTLVNNKYLGHFLVLLVFLVTTRMAGLRLRGSAVSLCEPARRRLLGPQRLRALPAGRDVVPPVLGRVRGAAARARVRAVGARARRRLARRGCRRRPRA